MARIPKELLEKYDRAGPRYTSYPPATRFHPGVGAAEYRSALGVLERGAEVALYLHIPFCERRCTYCGCYAIPTPKRSVGKAYLERCLREMELAAASAPRRIRASAVHLGGGTPTYLAPEEVEMAISGIRRIFDVPPAAEVAVEVDPKVTTEAHLDALRRAGANRISIGIQDTSPEVQEAIGRFQGRELSLGFVALCREKGFRSLNVDLVYGLPRQSPERFRRTLEDVLSVRPERFAVFGYAHVPWAKPHQKRIDARELPGPAARLELYTLAHEVLTGAGYRHIGMDHFALPEDELSRAQDEGRLGRNFMGYTPRRDARCLGFGVSSIGELFSGYFQNEKKLSRYYERVERGDLPIERGFLTGEDDRLRRFVIREILCNLRVDIPEVEAGFAVRFQERFAREAAELAELEADGLVEVSEESIRVTELGRLFLRNVAMVFDRYLRESPPAPATYSRTI
ncbi:MAG: oxygen-independent coproporphyrinogen III oxidase [Planctomycetota bacterium]